MSSQAKRSIADIWRTNINGEQSRLKMLEEENRKSVERYAENIWLNFVHEIESGYTHARWSHTTEGIDFPDEATEAIKAVFEKNGFHSISFGRYEDHTPTYGLGDGRPFYRLTITVAFS